MNLQRLSTWPVLAIISLPFLLSGLGSYGLLETSEARYAEISWEMVESGDWLTPRYNHIKHFHKPPLTYWAAAASMTVFGKTEFAARFPQALFGLGVILATFFIGGALFDRLTGFLAGLALLVTMEHFFISRYLITDMLLTLFIILSLLFYVRGFTKRSNCYGFFLSLSGAMMTKGPVGILLPALIIAIDLALAGRGRDFFKIGWIRGLLLVLVVSAPWFILVCLSNHGLFHYLVFFQTVDRFFTTVHHRAGSPFYFIPVFLMGFLPWTLLLPDLIKGGYITLKSGQGNRPYRLLVIWVVAPLIFFSLSSSKLISYLLPIFPATALLVGKIWRDTLEAGEESAGIIKVSRYLYIFSFAVLIFLLHDFLLDISHFSDLAGYDLSPLAGTALVLAFISIMAVAMLAFSLRPGNAYLLFPALTLVSLAGYMVLVFSIASVEPVISPTGTFVKEINKRFRPGDLIASYKCMLNGLPFYTGKRVITVAEKRETGFEEDATEVERYVLKESSALFDLTNSEKGLFLVIKRRHLKEVENIIKRPVTTLAATKSYILLYSRAY